MAKRRRNRLGASPAQSIRADDHYAIISSYYGTGIIGGSADRIAVSKRQPRKNWTPPETNRVGSGGRVARAGRRRHAKSVAKGDLSKRTLRAKDVLAEKLRIATKRVLPKYSKLSVLNCLKKRKEVRRDYFAYKKTRGSGAFRKLRKIRNRFTIRC